MATLIRRNLCLDTEDDGTEVEAAIFWDDNLMLLWLKYKRSDIRGVLVQRRNHRWSKKIGPQNRVRVHTSCWLMMNFGVVGHLLISRLGSYTKVDDTRW